MIDWREYLVRDPKICSGRLTIKGTRVLATNILDSLAEGDSPEVILEAFPSLKRHHIDAAVAYASSLLKAAEELSAVA